MLRIKDTAGLAGVGPEIVLAIMVASEVYSDMGYDCVVTSVTDSTHNGASLHYIGNAVDFRTKHVPVEKHEAIRAEIATRLGPQFDVILASDHIHLEFQPKENR